MKTFSLIASASIATFMCFASPLKAGDLYPPDGIDFSDDVIPWCMEIRNHAEKMMSKRLANMNLSDMMIGIEEKDDIFKNIAISAFDTYTRTLSKDPHAQKHIITRFGDRWEVDCYRENVTPIRINGPYPYWLENHASEDVGEYSSQIVEQPTLE